MDAGETDDLPVDLGHEEAVGRAGLDPREPPAHGLLVGGIAELPEQSCDSRDVGPVGVADRHAAYFRPGLEISRSCTSVSCMAQRCLLILLIAALTACGSVSNEAGDGPAAESEGAVAIRTVDRPAPKAYEEWANPDVIVTIGGKSWCGPGDGADEAECSNAEEPWDVCEAEHQTPEKKAACAGYREQLEQAEKDYATWLEEMAPAPGTEPRVVAELDLAGQAKAEVVAWHAAGDGKLCTIARVIPGLDYLDAQLVGECGLPYTQCSEACVSTLAVDARHSVLAGTLPASADAVRVTIAGRETIHPLSGPVIDGSGRRVFMLDLGTEVWRRLEVFADGRLVDTVELSADEVTMWECLDEYSQEEMAGTDSDTSSACVPLDEGESADPE